MDNIAMIQEMFGPEIEVEGEMVKFSPEIHDIFRVADSGKTVIRGCIIVANDNDDLYHIVFKRKRRIGETESKGKMWFNDYPDRCTTESVRDYDMHKSLLNQDELLLENLIEIFSGEPDENSYQN